MPDVPESTNNANGPVPSVPDQTGGSMDQKKTKRTRHRIELTLSEEMAERLSRAMAKAGFRSKSRFLRWALTNAIETIESQR